MNQIGYVPNMKRIQELNGYPSDALDHFPRLPKLPVVS